MCITLICHGPLPVIMIAFVPINIVYCLLSIVVISKMSAPTERKRLKKEEHENEVPIYIVDAFTSKAFEGNPAAVCLVSPEHVSTYD